MDVLHTLRLPAEVRDILSHCPSYTIARNSDMLVDLACRDAKNGWHDVAYDVPGKGTVLEARVCRVRNGIAAKLC